MSDKNLGCKLCGQVVKVPENVMIVTCNTCVNEMVDWPVEVRVAKSKGYPRGWKFMKRFVHQDGTVYDRGVIQPSLQGKLPPTEIKPKDSKTKAEKKRDQMQLLSELGILKAKLKKETRKTVQAQLVRQINKIQRKIK